MTTNLGKKINDLRLQKKLTLDELAQAIGVQKSYIWSLENRRIEKPSAEKLIKIAEALGVTIDYLLNTEDSLNETQEKDVLYRNFKKLDLSDQTKINKMIEAWIADES